MRFILKTLKAKNFKGFRNIELNFSTNITEIKGDNETGKTTLYDAFCYCINKKNSEGDTDFGIVPNFTNDFVSPEVELECLVDDKPVSLKRVYQAKFTRDKKFSGRTSECYINGIPVGAKEFESYIANIVNEDVFKLLTFPNYFTELMPPAKGETVSQRQCKTLRAMANIESDKDIAEKKAEYKPIVELLNRYSSVDDIQKFYKAEVKRIHQNIDDIPVMIFQQSQNLVEVSEPKHLILQHIADLEFKSNSLKDEFKEPLKEIDEKIKKIKSELRQLKDKHSSIVTKSIAHEFADEAETKKVKELKQKIKENLLTLDSYTTAQSGLSNALNQFDSEIMIERERIGNLKNQAAAINARILSERKELDILNPEICPLCGNSINLSKFNEYKEDVLKQIASNKSELLSIKNKIREREENINKLEFSKSVSCKEFAALSENIQNLANVIEKDKQKLLSENEKKRINFQEKIKALNEDIRKLENQLKKEENTKCNLLESQSSNIFKKKNEIQNEILRLNKLLNQIEFNESCKDKIKALEESRNEFNEQLDKAQYYLELSEKFIQERSTLLEDSVNSLFEKVKFKFTRENKSGKITEYCTPTFNGQNYKDLSASTKAICNLDIVKGFQKYYNCKLPVFVDNAEGITETLDINTQMILLTVEKEVCPDCGSETGRKQENELWKCKNCGKEFKKEFKVINVK